MDRLRAVWEEAEPDGRREYVWELDTLLEGGVFKLEGKTKKKKLAAIEQQKKLSTYRSI
jgi:hypothetical protein